MTTGSRAPSPTTQAPEPVNAEPGFDVSFIMPAYNEEEVVGVTAKRLLEAFARAGVRLELVAVDNGSKDRTGEILRALRDQYPNVVVHRIDLNEGYGKGVLEGIPLCRAPWVGIIPADGQVDADDVVRLYESAAATNGHIVAKVRRRFRLDGLTRKVVSTTYNLFVRLMWPTLASLDINGSPKLLRRDKLVAMELGSKTFLLDPELMVKAHYMGMRVLEFNVFARMRGSGLSHVRASTCWEFVHELLAYRFSPALRRWRRQVAAGQVAVPAAHAR